MRARTAQIAATSDRHVCPNNAERRFSALVAWSTVELAQSTVKYRADVSFVDPDAGTIEGTPFQSLSRSSF